MENSSDKRAVQSKDEQSVDRPPSSRIIRQRMNRAEDHPCQRRTAATEWEKRVGTRASKKQEAREEAKSILPSAAPHHDPRNESTDWTGPTRTIINLTSRRRSAACLQHCGT